MIDAHFVFLGAAISLSGSYIYMRDTWRGVTAPNRVTWFLWGLEPLLAYAVERQEHVGLASVMTLVLGVAPFIILAVSFHDPRAVWRIGRFDVVCGGISAMGLGVWGVTNEKTVALLAFVAADAVASLPTIRKALLHPSTESPWAYLTSALFAGITLLTLHAFTTVNALFPTSVVTMSTALFVLVLWRVGEKFRPREPTREVAST